MQFSDFAEKFFAVTSDGKTQEDFTQDLFKKIIDMKCEQDEKILDNYSPRTYRGFFSGKSISGISRKINAHLEPERFRAHIKELSDATVENLCALFTSEIPDIDSFNADEKLAALFVTIITEAAGKRKMDANFLSAPNNAIVDSIDAVPSTNNSDICLPHVLTKSNVSFASDREIIHREKEVLFIENLLETQKTTLLTNGFGGIGKTSIARVLYSKLAAKYDCIGWVEYRENLRLSLLAAIDLYDEVEDQSKRWGMIVRRLKNDTLRKILFIDNVDRDAEHGQDPLEDLDLRGISGWPNMTVVLTSRLDEIPGYQRFKVDYLGGDDNRKEYCSDLFYLNYDDVEYSKPFPERKNKEIVSKLVDLAGYHTYAVELLAKSAKYQESLDYYYERVKESGFSFPKTPVLTAHSHTYAEAAIQLRKLFNMGTRTKKERQILWDFAILPNVSLSVKEVREWLGYTEADLDRLRREGWLTYHDAFSLHPLVKETILLDLQSGKAPVGTLAKWEKLLDDPAFMRTDEPYSSIIRKLDISQNFIQYTPVTNPERHAKFCLHIGCLLFNRARKRIAAISYLEESLSIYCDLEKGCPGSHTRRVIEVSYHLGYIESATSGYRERCGDHLLQSLELCRKLEKEDPGACQVEIANASDHLGYIWSDIPDHRQKAEDLLLQAVAIRKTLSEKDPSQYMKALGTTYDNLGRLLSFDATRADEAERYLSEALSIRQNIENESPGSQSTEVAWTCNNIGDLLSIIDGRQAEAEVYYRKALAIREKMDADTPGLFTGNIVWTNVCLARLLYHDRQRWDEVEAICSNSLGLCSQIDAEHKGFFIDECAEECRELLEKVQRP